MKVTLENIKKNIMDELELRIKNNEGGPLQYGAEYRSFHEWLEDFFDNYVEVEEVQNGNQL